LRRENVDGEGIMWEKAGLGDENGRDCSKK